jgi:hypothetical protein
MNSIPDWKSIAHKAPARNERRVMVEVDVEPVNGQHEFCQNINHGKSTILIYESELATLERLTQTEDEQRDWAHAVRLYEAERDRRLAKIPAKDEHARQLAIDTMGQSPSSFFEMQHPGGKRPFKSHRVLARDIPPPETPANLQANQMGELAKALAQLIGLGQSQPATAKAR